MLDTNPDTRITVDEILRDPWFSKGYKEVKVEHRYFNWKEDSCRSGYGGDNRDKCLNAFDLISFTTGFDMSGLFTNSEVSDCVERIVSREKPERIMEKVEEVAKEKKIGVKRKESGCGATLEGQDGNLVIFVGIYRLTEELVVVVVEVEKRERGIESAGGFWEDTLKPKLLEFSS